MTLLEAYFAYRSPEPGENRQEIDRAADLLLSTVVRFGKMLTFNPDVIADGIQDTMTVVWTAAKYELNSDDQVRALLFTILKRKCLDIIDRNPPPPPSTTDDLPPREEEAPQHWDIDFPKVLAHLRVHADNLKGKSKSAAIELIDIHEGAQTFEAILAAEAKASPEATLETLRSRKYQQYKRALEKLLASIQADPAAGMWDRSILVAVASSLGLSGKL